MEQIVRDARIAQIYEGTNGVQALDLVGRKVIKDGGQTLKRFVDQMAQSEVAAEHQTQLNESLDRLVRVTSLMVSRTQDDPDLPGAVSTDYLELAGLTIYAWLWARMAMVAPNNEFGAAKRATAQFFFARLLPKTQALETSISADTESLMGFADDSF